MSILKALKLTAATRNVTLTPAHALRGKMVSYLNEQNAPAEAEIAGTAFNATKRVTHTNGAGEKVRVDAPRHVRKSWYTDATGKMFFQLRNGAKPLEFAKGMNAVEVQNLAALPAIIGSIIEAVHASKPRWDSEIGDRHKTVTSPFWCYEIQPMIEMDTDRAESALDDQASVHVLLALLKIHGDAFFRGQRKVGLAGRLVGLDLVEGRLGIIDSGFAVPASQADARILAFAFQPHAEVLEFTALLDDRVDKNDDLIIGKMLLLQAHTTPHVQVLLRDANTTVGSRIALA